MDEVEWIKAIKKAIVFITKIASIIIIPLAFLQIMIAIRDNNMDNFMIALSLLAIIPVMIILYFILYLIHKMVYTKKEIFVWDKNYNRDIPKYYNPAVISLVHDLNIDVYKDYTATVLNLYLKKYINILDNNKFEIINSDNMELQKHEKYVLQVISKQEKFDENEFKKLIIEDAQNIGFITNQKYSRLPKILMFALGIILIMIVLYVVNKNAFLMASYILVAIMLVGIPMTMNVRRSIDYRYTDTAYKRTNKGKEEAKKAIALKTFIKEYTLIKEKGIEHIQVLEEYIPYALALDEANAVEEFIKKNETYRNLIYNQENKPFTL